MLNFFFIGIMGIAMGGCSSLSDSKIIMNPTSERQVKPEYMPPEAGPLEQHLKKEKAIPIAPQVGIRIPLGK